MNDEALHTLVGLRPGKALKSALITLFRSSAPILPEVREALAKALERAPDEAGIRLSIGGLGKGGSEDIGSQIQVRERWLIAGREIERLHTGGMGIDEAKRQVGRLQDADGAYFGYEPSQASEAWAFFNRFRAYQAFRNEQLARARKNDVETEASQEAAFIIMAIYGGDAMIADPGKYLSG
ncbi:hypothetical protein MRBLMA1_000532 [Sphingobium sp. LMA1-1-1.1]|uniref:hypothetical protein n=1 Tax=Sphingobium sp. LMA1-1-1.1 TaxID=3135238 RepID=UPI003423BB48